MKVDVLDKNGKVVEKLELEKEVFGVKPNLDLVNQYIRVFQANQHQGTSSTKTRAEVSGGGRKPWKQKGTGRARHGSIRSPIWRGGGIAHGPKPYKRRLSLPKKMRKLALVSILSTKYKSDCIKVLDKIEIKKPDTKAAAKLVEKLKLSGNTLFVLDKKDERVLKSVRNLEGINTSLYENLNGYDLLRAKNIVFLKDAIIKLQKKYL